LKGNNFFSQNRFEEAIEAYTSALVGMPSSDVLYCNRAACYIALKRWLDAISDCGEALKLNRANLKAHYRLGE
jgi:tetratricopeptide (TPR) repeat protein